MPTRSRTLVDEPVEYGLVRLSRGDQPHRLGDVILDGCLRYSRFQSIHAVERRLHERRFALHGNQPLLEWYDSVSGNGALWCLRKQDGPLLATAARVFYDTLSHPVAMLRGAASELRPCKFGFVRSCCTRVGAR